MWQSRSPLFYGETWKSLNKAAYVVVGGYVPPEAEDGDELELEIGDKLLVARVFNDG